jgi:hypothetical protein
MKFLLEHSHQCRPIGNMLKTIDFIGDLKTGWCDNRHTPSHSIQNRQKAFVFDGFQRFLWDDCAFAL